MLSLWPAVIVPWHELRVMLRRFLPPVLTVASVFPLHRQSFVVAVFTRRVRCAIIFHGTTRGFHEDWLIKVERCVKRRLQKTRTSKGALTLHFISGSMHFGLTHFRWPGNDESFHFVARVTSSITYRWCNSSKNRAMTTIWPSRSLRADKGNVFERKESKDDAVTHLMHKDCHFQYNLELAFLFIFSFFHRRSLLTSVRGLFFIVICSRALLERLLVIAALELIEVLAVSLRVFVKVDVILWAREIWAA